MNMNMNMNMNDMIINVNVNVVEEFLDDLINNKSISDDRINEIELLNNNKSRNLDNYKININLYTKEMFVNQCERIRKLCNSRDILEALRQFIHFNYHMELLAYNHVENEICNIWKESLFIEFSNDIENDTLLQAVALRCQLFEFLWPLCHVENLTFNINRCEMFDIVFMVRSPVIVWNRWCDYVSHEWDPSHLLEDYIDPLERLKYIKELVLHSINEDIPIVLYITSLNLIGLENSCCKLVNQLIVNPCIKLLQALVQNVHIIDENGLSGAFLLVLIEMMNEICTKICEYPNCSLDDFMISSYAVLIFQHEDIIINIAKILHQIFKITPDNLLNNDCTQSIEVNNESILIFEHAYQITEDIHDLWPLFSSSLLDIQYDNLMSLKKEIRFYLESLVIALNDVPSQKSIMNMYTAIGSIMYIKNYIKKMEQYSSRIEYQSSTSSLHFGQIFNDCYSTIYGLCERIIHIHVDHCRTYIFLSLHKGSRGWKWSRAESLFKIERPSNAIVHWNLYLKGILCDLHNTITSSVCQHILLHTLLQSSISLLAQYSHITPSRYNKRLFQVDLLIIVTIIQSILQYCHQNSNQKYNDDHKNNMDEIKMPLRIVIQSLNGICLKFFFMYLCFVGSTNTIINLLNNFPNNAPMSCFDHISLVNKSEKFSDIDKQVQYCIDEVSSVCQLIWFPPAVKPHKNFDPLIEIETVGDSENMLTLHALTDTFIHLELPPDIFDIAKFVLQGSELLSFVLKRTELRLNDYPPLTDEEIIESNTLKRAIISYILHKEVDKQMPKSIANIIAEFTL